MDIGDLFLAFLLPGAGGSRQDSSPGEQLSAAVGCGVFPIADFSLVLFAGGWRSGTVAALLPIGLAAASVVLSRLLAIGVGATLRVALGSVMLCGLASGFALMLGVFGSFFSGF
jgi:hypothetical protein